MEENPQHHQNGSSFPTKPSNTSRPSSFYDNFRENGNVGEPDAINYSSLDSKKPPSEELAESEKERSPTQEFLLKTTVPQNLAAANLAGRHTPTRNSLRHSRMIVMNRTGSMPRSFRPPVIRHHRVATVLVTLQALLGATICCLSAWLLLWTPNLRKRDNPYWSGLPLLASGTVGLLLLCCFRRDHPGTLKGYLITGTKIFSVLLSLVAIAASLIASVFTIIHLLMLAGMECETKIQLRDTCFCQIGTNSTYPMKTYHYSDLDCSQVYNLFTILLIFSCVVNALGGIVSLSYVYLHCSTRYTYLYSKVRTKDTTTANSTK